jgi:hypothetical protein
MPSMVRFDSQGSQVELKHVAGYKITSCFGPVLRLQGNFFVYIFERQAASTPLPTISMGIEGANPIGTLNIVGDSRTYRFEKIELISVETIITQRERCRLLEFHYNPATTDPMGINCRIQNDLKDEVRRGQLEDDYTFSIDGKNENLLGFRSHQSASKVILRFSSIPNGVNQNSWLRKIVDVNNTASRAVDGAIPEFTVRTSKGEIRVNRGNLISVFVDESYGYLLQIPQPPLNEIVRRSPSQYPGFLPIHLERVLSRDFINYEVPQTLIDHYNAGFMFGAEQGGDVVETATIVFDQGHYRDLKIT